MIVDVAHLVATHHLAADAPERAKAAALTALRAGAHDDTALLDLVAACDATGNQAEAERLAREAVGLTERTDMLEATADAKLNLAGVLQAAGKNSERLQTIEEALALYEQKENVAPAERARVLLEELR